jgi:hypothetical protein
MIRQLNKFGDAYRKLSKIIPGMVILTPIISAGSEKKVN